MSDLPDSPTSFPRTTAVLNEWIASGHHIGAQVYVSRAGKPLADFAVGAARPDGVPMRADTVMLWLSASKPFAAVALAQLREKGLLDFNDTVPRFIPEFAAHGKDPITLKHILTHTAGLRFVDFAWPQTPWDQIIAKLCDAKAEPDWPLGQKAGYSPFATWFLLAEIVRRIDGRPYEDYVREEIFLPLGMHDSWLAMPPDVYRGYGDRIGIMMNTAKRPPEPSGDDTEEAAAACRPSGGGRGPARELGRFYEMMLAGGAARPDDMKQVKETALKAPAPVPPLPPGEGRGEGRSPGAPILSPASVQLLTQPHRIGLFDHTFRHVMDWGLGFILNSAHHGPDTVPYGYGPRSSSRAFGHGGAQSTCAFADPDRGLVVVIVYNGQPGEPAHQRRLRATLGALEDDIASIAPM